MSVWMGVLVAAAVLIAFLAGVVVGAVSMVLAHVEATDPARPDLLARVVREEGTR